MEAVEELSTHFEIRRIKATYAEAKDLPET